MFASLNEVGGLGSTGFRKLGCLELKDLQRITEVKKITTWFGEKVRLELEGFGWILLPEVFNWVMSDQGSITRSEQRR